MNYFFSIIILNNKKKLETIKNINKLIFFKKSKKLNYKH